MKKLLHALLIITALYSASAGAVIVRGTGTSALIGHDLTDPENNGNRSTNIGYNATFRSSVKPYFGGEGAFDVFNNVVGGGNDKWCCDNGNVWVEADFGAQRYTLTKFTAASANDVPERDSDAWKILGSNDGVNYTTIFTYNQHGVSPWVTRLQVNEYDVDTDFSAPTAYSIFRYQSTSNVSGGMHQISELEFFGNPVSAVPEPETYTMLLAGLGLMGFMVRRRKTS